MAFLFSRVAATIIVLDSLGKEPRSTINALIAALPLLWRCIGAFILGTMIATMMWMPYLALPEMYSTDDEPTSKWPIVLISLLLTAVVLSRIGIVGAVIVAESQGVMAAFRRAWQLTKQGGLTILFMACVMVAVWSIQLVVHTEFADVFSFTGLSFGQWASGLAFAFIEPFFIILPVVCYAALRDAERLQDTHSTE